MLLQTSNSLLLVIDIQSRLAPYIHQGSKVVNNTLWLIEVARACEVPVRMTEQYPQGIGPTVPPIAAKIDSNELLQKMHFSAVKEPDIKDHLAKLGRQQIIVTGTETHVCCLQTSLDLLELGYEVYLVEEALGSRRDADKKLGLQRMQQAGAVIVNKEMVAFEWLEKAGTDQFRQVSKNWIKPG